MNFYENQFFSSDQLPPPPSQQSVGPQNPSPYTISTPPAEQHIPASTATVVIPASPSQPTAHSTTVVVAGGRPIYDDSFNTGLILGSSIGHPWGWGWGFDPCCDAWRFDTDTSTIVNQTRVINDYTNVSDGVEGDATVDDSGKDVVDFDEGNDGDTYDAPDDSAPDTVDAGDGGGTYDAGGDAD